MKKKQKILYVVEAMGGGVFTYIVDLANKLVNDFDIYIAYATRTQTPLNYKEYFDERIQLIEVNNFKRNISFKNDIKAFFEIKRIFKEIKPDLIHLHSSKAGAIGRLAFNGREVPVFYTPHGYSFLMQDYSKIKRRIFKIIEKICSTRNCITICCSKGEYLEALKLSNSATYVSNGVNINELKQFINKIGMKNKNSFTVYTLGRICHQKNPKLFNEIARRNPDIKFKWIGDGEQRSLLNASNIEITGWIDRNEALKHSIEADVFLLTSLWEGLPISLLESMYMKKLCIVSDVIGNNDVINNNVNGFVCKDENDFVEAINITKESLESIDDNKIKKLLSRAYENVLEEYNTDVMAKKYKEIYIKEISERNNYNG